MSPHDFRLTEDHEGKELRFRFRLLDLVMEVRVEPELAPALAPLLVSYGVCKETPLVTIIARSRPRCTLLVGNKLLKDIGDVASLVSLLEASLYGLFLEQAHGRLVLHAAGVSRRDHALVLVGPSGAGKSTLALALLNRGMSYLSEEWIVFDNQNQAKGLSRPLHLDEVPLWERCCEHIQLEAPLQTKRSSLVIPPLDRIEHQWRKTAAVVVLNRKEQATETVLKKCDGSAQSLTALNGSLVSAGTEPLTILSSFVHQVPLYRLSFSDAREAAVHLEAQFLSSGD